MENNRIKTLRKAHGMTQVELAEKLGIAQGTVQKLENDQIEFSTNWMRKIATVLEVEPYELLPLDMQPKETTPEEREMLRTFRKFAAPKGGNNANIPQTTQDEKHTPQPSQPPHKSNER